MGKKIISMVLLIGLLAIMFFLVFVRGQSLTGKCFGYNEFFADAENDAFLLSKKIGSALKELCPVDKEKFDKNLIKLLEERRKLMLDDIENNPAKVLFIKELPVEIVSKLLDEEKRKLVEKRGRFSGGLDVYHEDYFDERKSRYLFYLNVDGKKYRLFSFQELPVVLSGTRANIEGITFEGEDVMVVDSNSGSFSILDEGEGGGGGVTDDNFGEQRTLVIVLKIGDNDPPLSVEKARGIIFGHEFGTLYDFYFKNSYGRVSFVGDILGPYVLSEDVCNIDFIKDRALEAAREDVRRLGKDYQDYDRLILLHPITPCIRAAGLGSIGKISIDLPNIHGIMSIAWIIDPSPSVLAHELGHNFGVSHASFYECLLANGEQTSYSYDCEKYEYGDSFSVMGYSKLSHHNAFHKKEIGWLTEENILTT